MSMVKLTSGLRVDIGRNALVAVSQVVDRIVLLRRVRRVEVVRGRGTVHPIQRYSAAQLRLVHISSDALLAVTEVLRSVVALAGRGGVEVVRGGRAVEAVKRDGDRGLFGVDGRRVALSDVA